MKRLFFITLLLSLMQFSSLMDRQKSELILFKDVSARATTKSPIPIKLPLTIENEGQLSIEKNSDLDKLVQEAVDRAFSTNTLLLNIFIAALAALATLLGVVSVIAGLYFFILRKSVEKEVQESITTEVIKRIQIEDLQKRLTDVENNIKEQTTRIETNINKFQKTLEILTNEFKKLQLMRKINEYVVDLPPEAVPYPTRITVQALLVDAKELLKDVESIENMIFTAKDYVSLGNTFLFSKQYKEALALYKKAEEKNLDDFDIWINKARCYYYIGQYDNALMSCKTAIRINPINCKAWTVRGTIHGKLAEEKKGNGHEQEYTNHLEQELFCYYKAIEIDSSYHFAWYNLACHYSLEEKIKEGFECLEKAIKYNQEIINPLAQIDPDLENLRERETERFAKLIYSEQGNIIKYPQS